MRTPICEQLDIEFPIFAFSHCRDVVAAVSKAGGYGVLGALAYSPDQLEIELSWIDEHVDGLPYGASLGLLYPTGIGPVTANVGVRRGGRTIVTFAIGYP